MKGIIIWKGKYGATDQYAHTLGSILHLPVVMSENVQGKNLDGFDFIILGSSVYIGKILLQQWLKTNVAAIQHKKIFFFIVCGTPSSEKDKLATIARVNIPEEIRNRCEVYFLRGRMIRKNLSWTDRFLLKMGSMFTKDPAEKKNMLEEFDAVKSENIVPLVNAINLYQSQKASPGQLASLAKG
jgi:menaquinone-dependent protoporphyrinogen IX oxidase